MLRPRLLGVKRKCDLPGEALRVPAEKLRVEGDWKLEEALIGALLGG
jgi:hypothetical protein